MENKKNFYIHGKWVTPKSKEEIKVINHYLDKDLMEQLNYNLLP